MVIIWKNISILGNNVIEEVSLNKVCFNVANNKPPK